MGGPTRTLPTGVVTFLMTDVEGSTRHWQRDPDAMALAEHRHREILHAAIDEHGGALPEEQGEGDSVVAAFASPAGALAAALDAQRRLAIASWPTTSPVCVRMAIHTGEARLRDERNYAGESIIRTARLRALAAGGQVLVGRATADAVAGSGFGDDAGLRQLGEVRLKDLRRPELVYQLVHPDLANEFPPLRGVEAYPNNLPIQLSSFVGREADLAQVHALVEDVRLLTLTGSGGCGKTRLALQVAADRLALHPDGTWYVELAPLGDADAIAVALAAALSLNVPADQTPLDAVLTELRDRSALLVIDNCEHLLDGAADVINRLLGELPAIRIVATSRQPLELPAETTWRVPSLGVPDVGADLGQLTQFDAVRLFVERALQVRPDFAITNDNAPTVASICSSLDGIPLAIELAASRVRSLPVERIDMALNDRFRLLAGGGRAVPDRHQTLRASVEWSHDLLTPEQQQVFRRLSQFAGDFDLAAVEAVATDDDIDPYAIFDVLAELVDRSLVLFDLDAERYRLLETMKQFGHEQLTDAGEFESRSRATTRRALLLGRATEAPRLQTGEQVAARDLLDRDRENLRLALEWWESTGDGEQLARLASDLVFFWLQTARFHDGFAWLERAATAAGTASVPGARCLWGRVPDVLLRRLPPGLRPRGRGRGRRAHRRRSTHRGSGDRRAVGRHPAQRSDRRHGPAPRGARVGRAARRSVDDRRPHPEARVLAPVRRAVRGSPGLVRPVGAGLVDVGQPVLLGVVLLRRVGDRGSGGSSEHARDRRSLPSRRGRFGRSANRVGRRVASGMRPGAFRRTRRSAADHGRGHRRLRAASLGGVSLLLIDACGHGRDRGGGTARGLELGRPLVEVARAEEITFFDVSFTSAVLGGVAMIDDPDELRREATHVVDRARALGANRSEGRAHAFVAAAALTQNDPGAALSELALADAVWNGRYPADRSEALRLAAWAHGQAGNAETAGIALASARAVDEANGWFLLPHVAGWEAAAEQLVPTSDAVRTARPRRCGRVGVAGPRSPAPADHRMVEPDPDRVAGGRGGGRRVEQPGDR
ncbi:MAG: AAA family ATPase [Ilumatobacteraceae bacterium]